VRKHFQRRRVQVKTIDDIWGADLVEMQEWSKKNKGFQYLLTVIDVFSKLAWGMPLKEKSGQTTLEAFKILTNQSGRQPKFK